MSLKAKGFLLTIMSLPDDWDFSINGITSIMPEGKKAIYAVIKELMTVGYCQRTRIYENGKIAAWVYTFLEQPSEVELLPQKVEVGNLQVGNLFVGKAPQYKNELNKERFNKRKREEAETAPAATKTESENKKPRQETIPPLPASSYSNQEIVGATAAKMGIALSIDTQDRIMQVVPDTLKTEWLDLVQNRMVGNKGAARNYLETKLGYWLGDFQKTYRFELKKPPKPDSSPPMVTSADIDEMENEAIKAMQRGRVAK